MNALPITSVYAGALGLLLIALSLRVVRLRMAHQVSLGSGGRDDLRVAQRQQGNFVEYVPLALGLVGLVELGGAAAWVVHALGATLLGARVLHPFGVSAEFGLRLPRSAGAVATWLVVLVASALLLVDRIG